MNSTILYILIFIGLFAFESVYYSMARRAGIVDLPTDRSSHSLPIVKGGGLVYFAAICIWFTLSGFAQWPLFVAFAMLAAVSFYDDLRDVSICARLAVQLIAACIILLEAGVGWIWMPIAIFLVIAIINSFNFMDGINGSLCLYSLILFITLALINEFVVIGFIDRRLLILSAIASAVFFFFNFRKTALCFAGDVGAIVVGAIAAYALSCLIVASGSIWWLALIAVYGADTSITLLRRAFLRQNILQSHRMHAYQIASNELAFPHLAVSAVIALIQIIIDLPLILGVVPNFIYFLLSVLVPAVICIALIRKDNQLKIK